ncbi:MAG: efflux RND transporter permease subunit, partial [Candidatus Dadabacteria bacterium]
KQIERDPDRPRREVVIAAAKEVGRPLFFSLVIITVSFVPVFTLEAQEGRLFRPLAFTKTFSMAWAALLAVTVVPPLMVLLIRGKITPEEKNPVNRGLIRIYHPVVTWVLDHRRLTIGIAVAVMLTIVPLYRSLGSEFMPPLNEGTILYMPTTLPGVSITEAQALMQTQDRLLKTLPEVESVFGKVGRARTPTDPAPLSMVETTVVLRPESEWRPGMTWEKLIDEMDRLLKFPGVTNAWTMPIKGRIDMLTTGIRTPVGIKILGPDLETIQELGQTLEGIIQPIEGTRSVYAERVVGGTFLDINVDRAAAGRYGLNVKDVEMIIETAIGGMNVDQTVEGPERYPVNVRLARDDRDSLADLERVPVATPTGAQVTLGMLADIRIVDGAAAIRNENGSKTGWVFIDVSGRDIGSYVAEAQRRVAEQLQLPAGYALQWSGQYEYMQRAAARLQVVVPITLLLILFLLYLNFRDGVKVAIVFLSLPFALVGSFAYLWLADYNLSVAVWVGIIALAGVAAETGVVMIVYLDEAWDKWRAKGAPSAERVKQAVVEGAVQRVRPKMMTVLSTMIGLVPILWSHGAGADVMKRIAAPMVGGMVTSTVLTLVIIPVIYDSWRNWQLRRGAFR